MSHSRLADPIMPPATNPHADLELIRQMMQAGRRSAAVDGRHLALWGGLLALCFFAQFLAVEYGWGADARPMIWIPLFVVGWPLSYWLGHRGPPMGQRGPVARLYRAAFAGAGIVMAVYFFANLAGGARFAGPISTVLACGVFGLAFFIMALATGLPWMRFVAFGWWGLLAYFSFKASMVLADILLLSVAALALLMAPGMVLIRGVQITEEAALEGSGR